MFIISQNPQCILPNAFSGSWGQKLILFLQKKKLHSHLISLSPMRQLSMVSATILATSSQSNSTKPQPLLRPVCKHNKCTLSKHTPTQKILQRLMQAHGFHCTTMELAISLMNRLCVGTIISPTATHMLKVIFSLCQLSFSIITLL